MSQRMYQILVRLLSGCALLASLLLAGCSSPLGGQRLPPASTYVLEDLQPAPMALDTQGPSIRIAAPVAAPGYNGAQLLYRRQDHRLEPYAYHRWVDAPARMLEPLLVRSLEASGRFRAVVPSHVSARTDLRLDSELLYLYQRFTAEGSVVELGLRVDLVDIASAQVRASRRFTVSEPVQEPVPYGAVQAANGAVTRLLQQLRAWLAAGPR